MFTTCNMVILFRFCKEIKLKRSRHNEVNGNYTVSEIPLRNCALHLHSNQNF